MEYKILPKVNNPDDLKALPKEELFTLAAEIRDFLCRKVSVQGGHLASNLGVVELTIALHRVFHSPEDHIIFDVGHQSYVHKILTGRRDLFDTLRTPGGLSGFTKRTESEHDPFGAGHASTSVSAALGFAMADKLAGRSNYTIAVLGDGAYTGGLVHEALNNCRKNLNLIIILNENEMSISPNTGTFARQISKIRTSKSYYSAKRRITRFVLHVPVIGYRLFKQIAKMKKAIKNIVYGCNYFEELGLYYLGPVDGNDYEKIERMLQEAKLTGQSTVVHIKTTKGKGYAPAESEPAKYHGIPPAGARSEPNFSCEFGNTLCGMAKEHQDICAITAAMSDGTGLNRFRAEFPERFFDVGIAEAHAATFAAALAADGMRPFFAVYSSFLQRAYDNILHDVALQRLPVVFCVDRASLSAGDGPTHHGIYDVALLNTVPEMEIYAPYTFEKLHLAMQEAYDHARPAAIRYPNRADAALPGFTDFGWMRYDFANGSPDTVVITYGAVLSEALEAKKYKNFGIILLEKLKPYSECAQKIRAILPEGCKKILFLEEGVYAGGAGILLKEELSCAADFRILAIQDFAEGKAGESLYKTCGISYSNLLEKLE